MSDLAVPQPAADRVGTRRVGTVSSRFGREALPILVVAICALEVLSTLRYELGQDGWLTLLGGRIVAAGLPHHDTLTAWAHGASWVDQQWLAQLVFYGAYTLGGVKAALLFNAALATGAFALAVVAARLRGASPTRVALVAVLCVPIVAFAWPLRAQSLAYPLFVGLLWLLAEDVRRPSRRVWLVVPLLVLWANLHGSVVLAATLVALRGVVGLVGSVRGGPAGVLTVPGTVMNPSEFPATSRVFTVPGTVRIGRSVALVATPVLLLFASPYGFDLAGYYHRLLLNSSLTTYIVEWQPTTPKPVTAPFFLMAFAAVWLIGKTRGLTGFERLALLLTMAAALASVRSIAWFGFTAVALLPSALEEIWPSTGEPRTSGLGVLAGAAGLAAALVFTVAVAARPVAGFDGDWSPAAGAAVAKAAAANPSLRVVSSLRYADWLLFTQPQLAGRIDFDARLELLSQAQVKQVVRLANAIGESWKTAGRNSLFVVDRKSEGDLDRSLRSEPGARTLYVDDQVRVVRGPESR